MNNLDQIKKVVEKQFNIPTIRTNREKDSTVVVDAKKTYSLISRNITSYSFREIAEKIGLDNHSLIVYFTKKARNHYECENIFKQNYDECITKLNNYDL